MLFRSRDGQSGGTWITESLIKSYSALFEMGYAQSVEVWEGDDMVGGLYGVRLGEIFFGESMFAKVPNASKFGFISFVKQLITEGVKLIDCQQETSHLTSLGGRVISREDFYKILNSADLKNRKKDI